MGKFCRICTQDQKFNVNKKQHDTVEDEFTGGNTNSIIKNASLKKVYFDLPCRLAIAGYVVRF
jgi:hypothetical protein